MDPEIERAEEERRAEAERRIEIKEGYKNLSVEQFLRKSIRNDVAREMFELFNLIQKEGEFSQDDHGRTMGSLFEKNSKIVNTFYASRREDSQKSISEGMQFTASHESDSQPDAKIGVVAAEQLREEKKQRQ